MRIVRDAIAGSLESSDILVSVSKSDKREIIVESSVLKQYEKMIKNTILEVLEFNKVENGSFYVQDKGALDFTIRARIETVICRGGDV